MKHLRISGALLVFLIILGCSRDPLSGANDPKDDSWNLDYIGPSYMSGWVEHITVEDMKGFFLECPSPGRILCPALGHQTQAPLQALDRKSVV